MIVPDARHIDLYDDVEKIPFDKLEAFFTEQLRVADTLRAVSAD